MNPARRPMRRMSREAGIVVSAVATIASEIGTVASDGRGAISRGDDAAENHDHRQAGGAQHLGGGQHEYITQGMRGSAHGASGY